jgi:inorganic pyrophosphatase
MNHFFRVYKQLEGKDTIVNELGDRAKAVEIVAAAIDNYVENFCK